MDLIIAVRDFENEVLARSHEVPVLVDFWADWCAPCRMVSPALEKLTREFDGAFVLAKVDTEEHPQVAMKYQVRSIPDVRLFRDGQVVDGFVGALPEARIRAFLQTHCPSEAESLAREGKKLFDAGDLDAAASAFERALALDDSLDAAHFALARVALARGDFDAVSEHAARIGPDAPEYEGARHLEQAMALIREARDAGTQDELEARLVHDADDLEARYALAAYHLASGRHRDALDHYLGVAERQRKWRDEAARKAMLTIFGMLGVRHELSNEFRRKLMLIY